MVYIIFIIISIFFIVISNQQISFLIQKVKSSLQTLVFLNTWMKLARSVHPYKELVRTCQDPFFHLSFNSLPLFYPECIAGEPYGELSDIWSFGITLYYCATGHFPYNLPGIFYCILLTISFPRLLGTLLFNS